MNVISKFLSIAAAQPEKIAIIDGKGQKITFGDLDKKSSELANYWQSKGIKKGDRMLLAMPIGIDLYATIAALWRLGVTIIFPESAMGLKGLKHAITSTKPKAILTSSWFNLLPMICFDLWRIPRWLHLGALRSTLEIEERVSDEHPALISFTSGSTGNPKGIVRSHNFLIAQNACVTEMLKSECEEIDLVAFPVFVIANLGLGITSVLPNWKVTRHDTANQTQILNHIVEHKITRALIPPSICEKLIQTRSAPNLKTIFTGGGPIFPDLMQNLLHHMPNTTVMAVYGSTEAEPISHLTINEISEDDWLAMESGKGLLAGTPIRETKTKIINDEILVTGDHVNKSYLDGIGDEENKVQMSGQIWHRTGDAGHLGQDGKLWLRGRWSAKAGNHFPFELEVAARCWPGVRSAALVPESTPPCLAISGDQTKKEIWRAKAELIGDVNIKHVPDIPLDQRHRSKVDYGQLKKLLKDEQEK